MRVLIDNGHGIETQFKESPDGRFKEYLWNREVAEILLRTLTNWGVPCQLLVPETNDIPLRTRVARANAVCKEEGKDNVLLVSIHSNMQGNGDKWRDSTGWCCYTSYGQTKSDIVADFLYEAFAEDFPEKRIRKEIAPDGDKDFEANFYILAKSACPAVLLENFFYDNKQECDWLLLRATQIRIAKAACKGIYHYLLTTGKI